MQRLLAMAVIGLALAAPVTANAQAQRQRDCLTTDQQRVAISSGQAVPLAKAIRAVRGRNALRVRGAGARSSRPACAASRKGSSIC